MGTRHGRRRGSRPGARRDRAISPPPNRTAPSVLSRLTRRCGTGPIAPCSPRIGRGGEPAQHPVRRPVRKGDVADVHVAGLHNGRKARRVRQAGGVLEQAARDPGGSLRTYQNREQTGRGPFDGKAVGVVGDGLRVAAAVSWSRAAVLNTIGNDPVNGSLEDTGSAASPAAYAHQAKPRATNQTQVLFVDGLPRRRPGRLSRAGATQPPAPRSGETRAREPHRSALSKAVANAADGFDDARRIGANFSRSRWM